MAADNPKSIGDYRGPYDKLRLRVFRWLNFFLYFWSPNPLSFTGNTSKVESVQANRRP